MSMSRPDHLPWLSGSEKPPSPTLTPQITVAALLHGLEGRGRLGRGGGESEGAEHDAGDEETFDDGHRLSP
jgi:hypothetical protein